MATRTLIIDLSKGTGGEPMYGMVTVQRTRATSEGTFEVLPWETKLKLFNGIATITEAVTDGSGPFYDSAYLIRVQNGYCAPRWGFMAALPDGTTPISTGDMPKVNPITGEGIYMDAQEWNALYGELPSKVEALEGRVDGVEERLEGVEAFATAANTKINTLETNRFFRGHNRVSDLNLAIEQGRYTFGSLPSNAPTTALGDVDTHVTGATIIQEWTTLESTPRVFTRRRSSGTWGAWVDSAERSMQGRGNLAPATALNTLCLPQHNGDYGLPQDNWAGYLNKPSDAPASGVRGTLRVTSPNNWTVTHELHINTGTVYWVRTMLSPTGPVFNPWRRVDTSLIGSGGSGGGTIQPLPTADWIHWGDSLTDDEALGADAWVTKLSALTGKIHDNEGWYGQQAAQIAARQGGNPALMTVQGGSIPASGTQVKVIAATPHVSMPVGAQQPARQVPGKLAGRTGYLVDGGTTAQDGFFMPTDGAGSSAASGVQQFIPSGVADSGRNRIMTICVGENDIWSTGPSPQHVAYMARQMNDYQSTNVKRVLVLSIPRRAGSGTGTVAGDKVTEINDALKEELPSAFVDLAGYMLSNQAATDAGITYSADDLADIAEGVTPRVFRLPSDSVHYNALGCSIIAPFVYAAARDRGWVS